MPHKFSPVTEDLLNLLDLGAIADATDKLPECEYFLRLAAEEIDKDKFRWLISAFLGAAYSFFEICAIRGYQSFHNPETGDPIENEEVLEILRRYVQVSQNVNRPTYIKTMGQHKITKELYDIRKRNTHHHPLSIMTCGTQLPEDFHFGSLSGKGIPALAFCREVMLNRPRFTRHSPAS